MNFLKSLVFGFSLLTIQAFAAADSESAAAVPGKFAAVLTEFHTAGHFGDRTFSDGYILLSLEPASVGILLNGAQIEARTLLTTTQYTDSCGWHIYIARRDSRREGGPLEEFVLSDTRGNTCPSYAALAPTYLKWTTKSASGEEKESRFVAGPLEPKGR